MKKLILLVFVMTAAFSAKAQNADHFGKEINDKKAIEASVLPTKMGDKTEMQAKVSGTVESVCQVKGCWMKVKLDNGETMRVMFKDYGFLYRKTLREKRLYLKARRKRKQSQLTICSIMQKTLARVKKKSPRSPSQKKNLLSLPMA